jgi:alkylhydroperoxidase family enzyme
MASHTALAKQLGVPPDLLDAMYHIDEHRDDFTEAERAALRLAEVLTTDPRGVDDEIWASLRAHYDEGQIVELVAVVGLFNYFNRFNEALGVEPTVPET